MRIDIRNLAHTIMWIEPTTVIVNPLTTIIIGFQNLDIAQLGIDLFCSDNLDQSSNEDIDETNKEDPCLSCRDIAIQSLDRHCHG